MGQQAEGRLDPDSIRYRPQWPQDPRWGIGLIGCGGISGDHLRAYRAAGFRVVALCDTRREAAVERQREFFPEAELMSDHRDLVRHPEVQIVDIATHPKERAALIRDALHAGRHVLSQKPFVTDLRIGEELVALAEQNGVQLAVNQNGRWAPHLSFLRHSIAEGWLGQTFDAQLAVHWDHGWVLGTAFEDVHHLILFDFAIHWFDIVRCLISKPVTRVYARSIRSPDQRVRPPLMAQAQLEFDGAQAGLVFNGSVKFAPSDTSIVCGTAGTAISRGLDYQQQSLEFFTSRGQVRPELRGNWFSDAFAGTMGELMLSIEEGRPSEISAADNLESLAVCFAAAAADLGGRPMRPWDAVTLPESRA